MFVNQKKINRTLARTTKIQNTSILQNLSLLNHFQQCRSDAGENSAVKCQAWSCRGRSSFKSLPQHSSPTARQTWLVLVDIGNCYMQLLILLYKVLCNCTVVILTVFLCPLAVSVLLCNLMVLFLDQAVELQNAEMFMYLR